jgi:phosphoribosylformylglycinamidine (FGAM) synthase-like enzyme
MLCNGFRLQRKEGIATSIGHAPISALIDPVVGSRNAIAESLSNLVWAIERGFRFSFFICKLDVGL